MPFEDAIAAGIAKAITELSKDVAEFTVRYAKGELKKLLLSFESGFQTYLLRNFDRCSKVKTLLHRVYPIDIHQAYVGGRVLATIKGGVDAIETQIKQRKLKRSSFIHMMLSKSNPKFEAGN